MWYQIHHFNSTAQISKENYDIPQITWLWQAEKCQDHPAGGIKGACYSRSSHSVIVIIMGLLQKRRMLPLAVSTLIGKLLQASLT